MGNASSARQLKAKPYPHELAYLHAWAMSLFGRSGSSMAGVAPLSYSEVAAWARLTDRVLEPYEVQALVMLDAAIAADAEIEDDDE